MDFIHIGYESAKIFKLILPSLFLGFFVANLIKLSPYLKYIGKPMSYLCSASKLPSVCSPALTMFFLSYWSGLSVLSDFRRNKLISDKEVLVAVLVGQIPKGLRLALFFLGPVYFSILGTFLGGILLTIELLIRSGIAVIGIIVGRLVLDKPDFRENDFPILFENNGVSIEKLGKAVVQSLREFSRVAIVLVPAIFAILTLLDSGSHFFTEIKSLLDALNLPPSSVPVLVASTASQIAAVSAAGALIAERAITPTQALLILLVARALHLSITCFRTSFPINVALFGKSLGLKITLVIYSLIELSIFLIILLIYL